MEPLRLRINRIIDFGIIVSLTGIDAETAEPVTIHIDRRAFKFWDAWREAGCSQPIEYEADRLIVHLDMTPTDDAETVELRQRDDAAAASNGNEPHLVTEVEQ